MRSEWEMTFVYSGLEALELMKLRCFDVVVTDMRMPEMDGADLLEAVKTICPRSVRIILSGQAEIDTVMKSVRCAHQYLAKPCNSEQLEFAIKRACRLRKIMGHTGLQNFVSELQSIPSQPEIYDEVLNELQSAKPSIEKIASSIAKDIGMSMKVMHLTSSSFFGQRKEVSSAREAVSVLGLDILRRLFADGEVFKKCASDAVGDLPLGPLHTRGLSVGNFALRVATLEGLKQINAEMCSTTALLCRVGCLILSLYAKEEYSKVIKLTENCQEYVDLERELFGTSHSEVGAYLLGLWGLPDEIVDSASRHHECSCLEHGGFTPLTALQIAENLASSTEYHTESSAENLNARIAFKKNVGIRP